METSQPEESEKKQENSSVENPAQSGGDRRRFRRANRNFVARTIPTDGRVPEIWNMVFIRNISKVGMLFNSDTEYKPGSSLWLSINILDSHDRVVCAGKVIRCHQAAQDRSFDVAVEFVEIKPDDRALIERSVDDYLNRLTDLGIQPD